MARKSSQLQEAFESFFEWLFNLGKEEAGKAFIGSLIEIVPNHIVEQFSDLNEQEKKGLEDIISKFQLRASLAGCNTENEAFQAIAPSIRELPLEKQEAVRNAVRQVLSQD
jgi:hypothetical protein